MKNTEYIDELLARFFANESLTETQKIDIEQWRVNNQELFDKLKTLAKNLSPENSEIEFDTHKAWKKIEPRIIEKRIIEKPKQRIFSRYITIGAAAAAAVLVMVVFGVSWYLQNQTLSLQYTNNTSKQNEIILPDHSTVTLYPGAAIQYNGGKKRGNREIALKGLAFFDVKKIDNRPFIVKAYNTQISVLGTSFFVDAVENNNTDIKVKTGKVCVTSNQKEVILVANQQAVVNGYEIIKKQLDDNFQQNLISNNNSLKFNKTPIQEVALILEKTFNVSIVIDQSLKKNTITTVVKTDNLEDILAELSILSKCKYKKLSNNQYELYVD